jgi:N-acetylneuraminic acid mutarotase
MLHGQITVEEVGTIPEAVSNNAVCEGFIDGKPYVFSFGGIDNSKIYSGIHLRSYRYDIENNTSIEIPSLPDTLGKIASSASRVGDFIYIIGGYHVRENETELSSNKVHRYDIINNQFIADGQDIPVPIDDQVQLVYKDSLIYVVTGWSNNRNVPDVQIYNPALDAWTAGTDLVNNQAYFAFGSSGSIVEDSIYFFGGANGSDFDPQFRMRKGIIDPDNPTQIEWSISSPDWMKTGYRMASTSIDNTIYWIGGSSNTYNFDGIAYDGSGGVSPTNEIIYNTTDKFTQPFEEVSLPEIPMDLRGIANVSPTKKYILGGMLADQEVTNKVYEITISPVSNTEDNEGLESLVSVYPNPTSNILNIKSEWNGEATISIYDSVGKKVMQKVKDLNSITPVKIDSLMAGTYTLSIEHSNGRQVLPFAVY